MAPENPFPATAGLRATRTRYWVVVFAITLAVVQYIDRVAISQAKGEIAHDVQRRHELAGWHVGRCGQPGTDH